MKKAHDLMQAYEHLRDNALSQLRSLYKAAELGENRLELGKHAVGYSDGAEYTVTALEWMWNDETKAEEWKFYQEEDGGPDSEVEALPLWTLLQVVEAVEFIV